MELSVRCFCCRCACSVSATPLNCRIYVTCSYAFVFCHVSKSFLFCFVCTILSVHPVPQLQGFLATLM